MRKTLGIDIDNTIADFDGGFRRYIMKSKGYTEDQLVSRDFYDFIKCGWFMDNDEFLLHFLKAEEAGLYSELDIFDNASDVIKSLAKEYDIVYVTARSPRYKEETIAWLEENNIWFGKIINEPNKQLVTGVDVFIDDADYQINNLLASNKKVMIANQDYNQYIEHNYRFSNWSELLEVFIKL